MYTFCVRMPVHGLRGRVPDRSASSACFQTDTRPVGLGPCRRRPLSSSTGHGSERPLYSSRRRAAGTLADRSPVRPAAGSPGPAAGPVLRVLSAVHRCAGPAAVGVHPAPGAAAAGFRVGDIRRRRQHPGAHPRHALAHPGRDRAGAGRPPDLRGGGARRGGRRRARLPRCGRAPHRGPARRSAQGRGLCAASRRLCVCRRSGGRPAPRR